VPKKGGGDDGGHQQAPDAEWKLRMEQPDLLAPDLVGDGRLGAGVRVRRGARVRVRVGVSVGLCIAGLHVQDAGQRGEDALNHCGVEVPAVRLRISSTLASTVQALL